jgi:CheY-like chemotaxis protein
VSSRENLEQALGWLAERVDRRQRELLVVASPATQQAIGQALAEQPEVCVSCASPEDAASLLCETAFDCVIVERPAGREEWIGELERRVAAFPGVALLWYQPDPAEERGDDEAGAGSARRLRSLDELLDASTAWLRIPDPELGPTLRAAFERVRQRRQVLSGRKALLVDDDIRNIFALASVLEKHGMLIVSAENGQAAIESLDGHPDIEVVLMDIMMPGMDGFETMREIRKRPQFRALPIVAVTARAMKGDREKTLRAGAWDYLAKPVDPERMLSVLEAWLRR